MGKRYRFSKEDRLLNGADFDRVFREGRRSAGKRLVVWAAPNGLARNRLGLAVSRAAGGAVRRNRIKRLVREAFRLGRERLPRGVDLVVSAARGAKAGGWTFREVDEELSDLVSRAGGARG